MPADTSRIKFGKAGRQDGPADAITPSSTAVTEDDGKGYSLEDKRRRDLVALEEHKKLEQPAVRPWILILAISAACLLLVLLVLRRDSASGTREIVEGVLREYQNYSRGKRRIPLTVEQAKERLNDFAQLKDSGRISDARSVCQSLLAETIYDEENPLNRFGHECLKQLR